MGVLDDAIREHLELKRQHGASEGDLGRQEAEALGPARREVPAAEPEPVPEAPLADEAEPVADEASLEPWAEEPVAAEPPAFEEPAPAVPFVEAPIAEEPLAQEPAPVEPLPAKPEGEPIFEEEPAPPEPQEPAIASEQPVFSEQPVPEEEPTWQEDAPLEPEELAAAEAGELEAPTGDTPPQGFEAVEEEPINTLDQPTQEHPPPPPPGETGEADVLEETPDFLEETPEHDRLWFEQKPPRDFDFDD